ncbi:hypothetical protein CK203_075162 [Vitis vinifera]|uniref:Uncharacterized protein n=1 Tax=Vitis vinifera TaxID=29760 RepID=A0A438F9R9_VITVI|nr:hypothetical protein CK203_075162 [Vitis vinifera]
MYTEAEQHSNQILETVMQSSAAQQFLTLGRVVVVKSQSGGGITKSLVNPLQGEGGSIAVAWELCMEEEKEALKNGSAMLVQTIWLG